MRSLKILKPFNMYPVEMYCSIETNLGEMEECIHLACRTTFRHNHVQFYK